MCCLSCVLCAPTDRCLLSNLLSKPRTVASRDWLPVMPARSWGQDKKQILPIPQSFRCFTESRWRCPSGPFRSTQRDFKTWILLRLSFLQEAGQRPSNGLPGANCTLRVYDSLFLPLLLVACLGDTWDLCLWDLNLERERGIREFSYRGCSAE